MVKGSYCCTNLHSSPIAVNSLCPSFGEHGYVEAVARSDNGEIDSHWTIDEKPLFADNGGHGMIFQSKENQTYLVLHQPNKTPEEPPVLIPLSL